MSDYVCVIQEGQEADKKRPELAEGLTQIGVDCFGDDPAKLQISWTVVGRGFAWTAGKPSRSTIVARSVPVGLPVDQREAFMHRVCSLWKDVTGCTTGEIVITAWDGPLPV